MNFAIGLNGLNTAANRLENAAGRIAHATTVEPQSNQGRGQAADTTTPADTGGQPQNTKTPPNNTDLTTAMVDQIAASTAFMANIEAIRRADENLESLLTLGQDTV
ncbi:MAG: flagellar basal body rod C-terminal domain-containing protein [Burkholderiaceae bacterium]